MADWRGSTESTGCTAKHRCCCHLALWLVAAIDQRIAAVPCLLQVACLLEVAQEILIDPNDDTALYFTSLYFTYLYFLTFT